MAGVICQHRMVQTRIQHMSPCVVSVNNGFRKTTMQYLVVWRVEVLRDRIATLRVDLVVWPFCDGCDFRHDDLADLNFAYTGDEIDFLRMKGRPGQWRTNSFWDRWNRERKGKRGDGEGRQDSRSENQMARRPH